MVDVQNYTNEHLQVLRSEQFCILYIMYIVPENKEFNVVRINVTSYLNLCFITGFSEEQVQMLCLWVVEESPQLTLYEHGTFSQVHALLYMYH